MVMALNAGSATRLQGAQATGRGLPNTDVCQPLETDTLVLKLGARKDNHQVVVIILSSDAFGEEPTHTHTHGISRLSLLFAS